MKDKFKAVVGRTIENDKDILKKLICVLVDNPVDDVEIDSWWVEHDGDIKLSSMCVQYTCDKGGAGSYHDYSLSDLLFNREFMRALVGNGCTNFKDVICTEDRVCTFSESCETCEYYAPINTMIEAAMLPTDQQRIDYVHGLIKGESK